MNRRKRFLFILVGIMLIGLNACAGRVYVAAPELDAQAKAMTASDDKALAYVYRNEAFGGGISMRVKIDGRDMGVTGPRSFMVFQLAPGKHIFASEAENVSVLDLDAKAGETYYVWQEVKMGFFFARTKLSLMDAEQGRNGVMECDLVVHNQP